MSQSHPSYSRDEVVSALDDFYQFLAGLHLSADVIATPPPDGWSEIDAELFHSLGKNDSVIDLLKRIPYVRSEDPDEPNAIYEGTTAVDYLGDEEDVKDADPLKETTILPSHVVTLARPASGGVGYWLFLDTERGTITMCDFQDGPNPTDLSQDIDENSRETWRRFETYPVKAFFEMLKEQYRSLEVMPTSATEVQMVKRNDESKMDRLKEIYRAHGWPSGQFRKEECMDEVSAAWEDM